MLTDTHRTKGTWPSFRVRRIRSSRTLGRLSRRWQRWQRSEPWVERREPSQLEPRSERRRRPCGHERRSEENQDRRRGCSRPSRSLRKG
jgi:hypothetical protein